MTAAEFMASSLFCAFIEGVCLNRCGNQPKDGGEKRKSLSDAEIRRNKAFLSEIEKECLKRSRIPIKVRIRSLQGA